MSSKITKIIFLFLLILNPVKLNFIYCGINFSNKDSKISVNNSANLGIRNFISSWSGTLENKTGGIVSGSSITFDDGVLDEEETINDITGVYSPDETIKLFLGGSKTFKATSGTSLNKINVFGLGNRIEGQPIFSNTDSIRLEHQNTNLTIALQSNLNSDIELRGGTVNLDNDLKFTEDRIFTGSGTVDLQGYGLYFGGKRDLNLTHTINWQNSTDINLTGKTDLSGLWSFDGPSIVNGHGNVLDMSTGGEFYLGHQASLELTDIVIRGIGTDKGNIRFQDNTSTLSTSNVHFDFDDSFSMTVGKMYVDGPTTISGFFSSSRTIGLQNDLFLSGNVTLSCGQGISGNGNTLNLLGNLNIQENTPLHFMSDTLVEGNGNTIVLQDNAQLFVDTDVSVTLRNVNIKNSKNYLAASPIKLAATTSKLALDNARLSFIDDFYFDRGQIYFYNDVEFTGTNAFIYRSTVPSYIKSGANLKFNPDTIFDFRPSTTGEPCLLAKDLFMMEDFGSKITFDGCTLKTTLTGFNLTKGSVFFDNRVSITSASILDIKGFENNGNPVATSVSYGDWLYALVWSPNGRYVAIGGEGSQTVEIFEFTGTSCNLIATSENYGGAIWTLSWSPDGRYVAVGGSVVESVKIFEFTGTSCNLIATSENYGGAIWTLSWSPDGRYVAVGGNNQTVKVFEFTGDSCNLTGISADYGGIIASLIWSPSGKYIAAGGQVSQNLQIFQLVNGNFINSGNPVVTSISYGGVIRALSWSSDGRLIAVGGDIVQNIQIFEFNGTSCPFITASVVYGATIQALSWSSDGRYIIVGGRGSQTVQVFELKSNGLVNGGNPIATSADYGGRIYALSWNPDGKFISAVGGGSFNIQVFESSLSSSSDLQAFSNSIVFGNSELGSSYDVNLRLLSGAYVEVDGMLNYDNTLGLTVFSNDNAKFVLKDSNSYIRLNPVNVFGWKERSLLKNITGAGMGDYNLLTYDLDANDIISYAEAPSDFIYNNSNAIVSLDSDINENSNAIVRLESQVKDNSNAIVTLEDQVEQNSNAIMRHDVQIKDNSNAIKNLEEQIKENSNAVDYLELQIKENSNAIKNLETQIKDNSNVINNITPFVVWNSNAIVSEADIEIFVRTNSNAILSLESQVENNSNAILTSDDPIRWNSDAIISIDAGIDPSLIKHNSNAIVSAIKIYDTTQTYNINTSLENLVLYKNGFTINNGKTLTLNTPLPTRGPVDLSVGKLILGSDLTFDSDVTLPSGGVIDGNNNALHLSGNLVIPEGKVLHLAGNTIIEGHGNTLELENSAQLFVDTEVSVTLRNLVVKNTRNNLGNPALKCASSNSQLTLDNVKLNVADDFNFNIGQFFVYNDVEFTGTSSFIYESTNPSYIKSKGRLTFAPETAFNFKPASLGALSDWQGYNFDAKDLIFCEDKTSEIYLNGCTLKSTSTGLRLTKGNLKFDNKVSLTSAASLKMSGLSDTVASLDYGTGVNSISWRPDGKYVALAGSGGGNFNLKIYSFDGNNLNLVREGGGEGIPFVNVKWSLDGRYLVDVGGIGSLSIFSFVGSGDGFLDSSNDVLVGALSPDNKYLATGSEDNTYQFNVYSFDGYNLNLIDSVYYGTDVRTVDWHPDGKHILIGGSGHDGSHYDMEVYFFNGTSLSRVAYFNWGASASTVHSVAWSSDGHSFVAGFDYQTSHLIEVFAFDGSNITNFDAYTNYGSAAYSVDWSNDGRCILVGGDNEATDVTLYRFEYDNSGSGFGTLTSVATLPFGTDAKSVEFSYDGKYILVGGDNSPNDLSIYEILYGPEIDTQAVTNSIIFGNLNFGLAYDFDTRLLSGAFVDLDGILNIDNTLTTSIFDNDVSKFVLKDSNSKIRFAASDVNGFVDRSIMKQVEGRGFGDYNLLNYDTGADDIITYAEAPADLLISNSNAIVNSDNQIRYNSNAIATLNTFFTDGIKNNSNTIISLEAGRIGRFLSVNDGILYAIGAINGDTTINGRGILSSPINLNGATLTNGGDILFSSGTTIESSGNLNPIGHAYILGGDITLPENVDLKFTTSGIIDGQGHSWTFGHNSKIRFDEYITVTFRNIKLNNVRTHSDGNASISILNPWRSKLVLANSEINMSDNFSFTSGELFLHGDVKICGTTQFNYTSTSFARITSASQLYFDQGVTFSYGPSITDNRDLINMEDETSAIYLNGCTLKSTTTGLRLKIGRLIIDGKIIAYNQDDKNGAAASLSQAISFGDGVNDLDVEIMPAANIEMMSGILDVN